MAHKNQTEHTRKWRHRNWLYIQAVKGLSECETCGESRATCLDFHHRDPESKRFSISEGTHCSIAVLDKEIKKCIIICANCHRVLHEQDKLNEIRKKPDKDILPSLFD